MSFIVDVISIASLLGIWPRFIEPRRLSTTHLSWKLEKKWHHLLGLKIIHLSDLHFHANISSSFLKKILRKVHYEKPDLILFTGDFLCYSQLEEPEKLTSFLCNLKAPLGSFCCLGNHDYANYVSLTQEGVYDLHLPPNPLIGILRGVKTLISASKLKPQVAPQVLSIPLHENLCQLLNKTPFTLLENSTTILPIGLNLTGLGDLALGRCQPEIAFKQCDPHLPGIILSHNPDSFPRLLDYPGNWILSGHTHGEQIHIPWPKWGRKISQRLARLQNSAYSRGLYKIENKTLYVNRGLGGHKPFRLFSPPEISVIHTESA